MLVAGGGLAYSQTGQRRPHRDYSIAQNGNEKLSEIDASQEKALIAEKKQRWGGIKNVEMLAALLLQHIGKGGLNEFIALATISVSTSIFMSLQLATTRSTCMVQVVSNWILDTVQVLKTALSNRLAKVQGWLFRAVFLTRAPLFMRLITENLILCFLQSAFLSTTKYLTGALSLRFRKIITNRIHADYFQVTTAYLDGNLMSEELTMSSILYSFIRDVNL